MAITPSRQRNAVSEGMALGLLMCDRITLPWDKVAIDLSFEGAWRSWDYKRRFAQVDTDKENSEERRRLRAQLYKPVLALPKDDRAEAIDKIMQVLEETS